MIPLRHTTLFMITLFGLTGCADILEKDLTGYGVVLLTPPDGYETTANVVQFRWEAVPEAEGYRLQLATPDMSNPVVFLADSLVPGTSLSLAIPPGQYQWRVRAENPNSHTAWYTRSVIVSEASSLDGLTPILAAPANNAAVAADPLVLTWSSLTGAEDYRVELRSGGSTGTLLLAEIVTGSSWSPAGVTEGTYAWGVQGQNTTSSSQFSYRTLRVDRTAPGLPVLISPTQGATLPNAPFTLQWQSGADSFTLTQDSLYLLSTDQQAIRSVLVTNAAWNDSLGPGTYSWFVRTLDEAGNRSTSVQRTFTVQ
jgi:hypothetical protein